jgi:hypothetical protein
MSNTQISIAIHQKKKNHLPAAATAPGTEHTEKIKNNLEIK